METGCVGGSCPLLEGLGCRALAWSRGFVALSLAGAPELEASLIRDLWLGIGLWVLGASLVCYLP